MSRRHRPLTSMSEEETASLREAVNYLYHRADYSPSKIARDLEITVQEVNQLLLDREAYCQPAWLTARL